MSRAVAVTGASGFVGSHVVDALRARGDRVRVLVRPSQPTAPDVERVEGRLDDVDALRRLADGADLVIHVAGATAALDEAGFLAVNRDGTQRVVEAAARVPRLVYVSSLAVTGPGVDVDESGPPRPVTPYGRSKAAGEDVVRAGGVPFTIVRPPVVYGPRDAQLLRVFKAARLGLAPLLGDGHQRISLVHARDLAAAIVAAAETPAGRTYHAGHDEPLHQRELVASIGAAVGRRPRVVPLPTPLVRAALHVSGAWSALTRRPTLVAPDKAPEFLAPAWTCSSAALQRDTGWRAATNHADGFRETAEWYRAAGWL